MTQLDSRHYEKWLTAQAKSRHPSVIRTLFPLENNPGIISLLAGKPNPETFPFENITVTLKPVSPGAPHPKLELNAGPDLAEALQYTATAGLPRLHKFVTELQHHVHGREPISGEDDFGITITNGSQDAFTKACAALIEQGDYVLIESPVYTGAIPEMTIAGAQFVEIDCDGQGMSAEKLSDVMENWPEDKPRPKLVYTVPTGNNPSGASAGKQRKIDILNLARKHDFLILEDDPYYFLTFDGGRVPSYFALEKELGGERGRVLRLDSMSKVLSSGLRIGWATGPKRLIQAMDLHTSSANLQPNSTSQAIVQQLFNHWGIEGLLDHVTRVAGFYRTKRDAFEKAAEKYMGDIATWVTPKAAPEGGYKWLARNDIPEDAEIVSVNKNICITESTCKEAFKNLNNEGLPEKLLIAVYISLHYIYDQLPESLKSKLHHRRYVDILPEIGQTLTTLYWTDDELEYTKPTSLFNATKEREIQWKSDYEVVKKWSSANDVEVFTWDVFKHSLTMISSRAFPSKLIQDDEISSPMLVPLWDIGNHKSQSAIVWTDVKYTGTDNIGMKLPQGAQKDNEVFNNYGGKPTNELLLAYGFAVDNINYDVVPFRIGAGVSLSESKKDILKKHSLLNEDCTLKTFNINLNEGLPLGLKFLMRLLADDNLTDEGSSSLEELENKPSNNPDLEFDIHVSLYQILANKSDSTAEYLSKLEDSDIRDSIKDMLVRLLTNQHKILNQAVDKIEEILESLDEE
ncbi:SET domain-containing protein [Wallemia mellicola]|uniref:SET domain-containing protein n=1 Tax=Wallemia mellicola TaxID=1708541 RepID=A0A4T0TBA3_9BASI|nr:SET domain-containing protein [Wallemia mellicola]